MAYKSININHPDTNIQTKDGSYLQIAKDGAIQVGYGIDIDEDASTNSSSSSLLEFAGAIRFNKNTSKLEYCDGTNWVEFITQKSNDDVPMVYSMLF